MTVTISGKKVRKLIISSPARSEPASVACYGLPGEDYDEPCGTV